MPSTDTDGARFTSVDWAAESDDRLRPDGRSAGLVLALAALGALFAYDYVVGHEELFWFVGWDPSRIGWLFLLTTVLFVRYAAVPLVANRERSVRYLRAFVSRPAGALSLAYLLGFAVIGLVGPETFYDPGYSRLEYRFQPPVFASFDVSDQHFYTCAGQLVGDSCHGSWRYPLGTTRTGEDVLELVLAGVRVAFLVAVTTATVMAVVATVVGTAAGYFRGWVDDVLMGYVNVQQTIPAIVVYIVLATMFFGNIEGVTDGGAFVFVLVFGLLDWGGIARQVRGDVLRRRSAGYVRAALTAGCADDSNGGDGTASATPGEVTATATPADGTDRDGAVEGTFVFVFNTGDGTVSVVDADADAVVGARHADLTATFPSNQYAPALTTDPGDPLWLNVDRGVRALEAGTFAAVARRETGSGANWQEVTPDGRHLVVSAREPSHANYRIDADPDSDSFGESRPKSTGPAGETAVGQARTAARERTAAATVLGRAT